MATGGIGRRLPQGRARTRVLRVPWGEWARVVAGDKTEVRWSGQGAIPPGGYSPPEPVVGYSVNPFTRVAQIRLLVLEATWKEPLNAISEESLEREGCEDVTAFKRYWRDRHNREFLPMRIAFVYRVRPFDAEDRPEFERRLFDRLYGAYQDGEIPEDEL